MEVEEDNPHSLPSSVVPRLHAVVSFKLEHSNPCLSTGVSEIGTVCHIGMVKIICRLIKTSDVYVQNFVLLQEANFLKCLSVVKLC
jgi:hypothetical protein